MTTSWLLSALLCGCVAGCGGLVSGEPLDIDASTSGEADVARDDDTSREPADVHGDSDDVGDDSHGDGAFIDTEVAVDTAVADSGHETRGAPPLGEYWPLGGFPCAVEHGDWCPNSLCDPKTGACCAGSIGGDGTCRCGIKLGCSAGETCCPKSGTLTVECRKGSCT